MNGSQGILGREVTRESTGLETYKFLSWEVLPMCRKTERNKSQELGMISGQGWSLLLSWEIESEKPSRKALKKPRKCPSLELKVTALARHSDFWF